MTWFRETRGVQFELVRHFLGRMFDGEWGAPGQWQNVAVGAISLLLPAGILLIREGYLDPQAAAKYRALAGHAEALRAATIADELSLVTLVFCITGLVALLEWQSLFPSGRDYLALAGKPILSRQIFTARFLSVLIFSTAIIVAMNLLPSLIAPLEFTGRWQEHASFLFHMGAQAAASGLACFFVFFGILALQGALLNLLPARWFARVSVYVQGALIAVLLLGGLYSWSIKEWQPGTIARLAQFGAWLPPVWFTGLHENLVGDPSPFFAAMGQRALAASGVAAVLSVCTYLLSNRRYRKLLLETPVQLAAPRVRRFSLLHLLARDPQQEAAMQFMAKTLARSRSHRILWLAYIGGALAIMLNSSMIDGAIFARHGGLKAVRFLVLFWPLACSVVMLSGIRHVMSVPSELRANWMFQITESLGRKQWMRAMERFVMAYAVLPVYAVLTPVAVVILGWGMTVRMTILQVLVSLFIFEVRFHSWQQLPFTCSYRPAQKPLVAVLGGYFGVLCVIIPLVSGMIAAAAEIPFLYPVYLVWFTFDYVWARKLRRDGWGESKLLYEDLADSYDLGLGA
ncbi:MAG: hypothetical protein P4L56_06455 [Candidatus Sulfopaludibacter sp.]|nr:hypothetical protein [Candidatus Sulfopaludibacter sp.]